MRINGFIEVCRRDVQICVDDIVYVEDTSELKLMDGNTYILLRGDADPIQVEESFATIVARMREAQKERAQA